MRESKRCGRCGRDLPLTAFALDRTNRTDGRQGHCLECRNEYNQARKQSLAGAARSVMKRVYSRNDRRGGRRLTARAVDARA